MFPEITPVRFTEITDDTIRYVCYFNYSTEGCTLSVSRHVPDKYSRKVISTDYGRVDVQTVERIMAYGRSVGELGVVELNGTFPYVVLSFWGKE